MKILGGIQIRALGIALLAFYLAPILPLIVNSLSPVGSSAASGATASEPRRYT